MTCRALGETAAALVDGELGHAARERAQAHLIRCADCRAEVDAQRRLKARLAALPPHAAGADLTARLLGLGSPPPAQHVPRPAGPAAGAGPAAATGTAGPARGRGPVRPVGAPRPARAARSAPALRKRRTTTASALAVLSVGLLVSLGGARPDRAVTPVDPAGDSFVVDYVTRTTEVPVSGPVDAVTADLAP